MTTYLDGAVQPPLPPAAPSSRRGARGALLDLAIVAVWFAVLGVVAGLVWWQLVDLPMATRSGSGVVVEADQLGKQVGIDGWFFVVSAVGGLASGLALLVWRRRDPLLMVALVTLGGGLASFLTVQMGRWLGPGSEVDALRGKAEGAHAPMPLALHAHGMLLVFPIAGALGALLYLWVLRRPDPS